MMWGWETTQYDFFLDDFQLASDKFWVAARHATEAFSSPMQYTQRAGDCSFVAQRSEVSVAKGLWSDSRQLFLFSPHTSNMKIFKCSCQMENNRAFPWRCTNLTLLRLNKLEGFNPEFLVWATSGLYHWARTTKEQPALRILYETSAKLFSEFKLVTDNLLSILYWVWSL